MKTKTNMEITMTKINKKSKDGNFSIIQILGGLLLIFAITDFALSWMGINLTNFMGPVSRYSPIIFGLIGSALMNIASDNR